MHGVNMWIFVISYISKTYWCYVTAKRRNCTCDGSSVNILSSRSRAFRSKLKSQTGREIHFKGVGRQASNNIVKQKCNTYCLKTSLTRLLIGREGLKLLYHAIFVTPGQFNSSGVPQSSNILVSCSGCIRKQKTTRSISISKFGSWKSILTMENNRRVWLGMNTIGQSC